MNADQNHANTTLNISTNYTLLLITISEKFLIVNIIALLHIGLLIQLGLDSTCSEIQRV